MASPELIDFLRELFAEQLRSIAQYDPSYDASRPAAERDQVVLDGSDAHRYKVRNAAVLQALATATALGLPAGIAWDYTGWYPVVVYIELPDIGQVSWHLPAYEQPYDGHTTELKYERVGLFTSTVSPL